MSQKIILDKNILIQKYKDERLSQRKIANYFHCSVDTVVRNLREYNIESNNNSDYHNDNIRLTDKQIEVLNGAMLGDGALAKTVGNPYLHYTSSSKQHVAFVKSFFDNCITKKCIASSKYFDKRTNKTYKRFSFRTSRDAGFLQIYYRWYKSGHKSIPMDLLLTPLTCLIWYIGDGCICHSHNKPTNIKLATQCFDKEELETIILPQLKQFEAQLRKADVGKNGKQQYSISIPRRKIKMFLMYIGECPFEDYAYKWDIQDYIRNYESFESHKHNEQQFCDMYRNGMTYYAIAKHFNITPNAVKYYLIKNNLYKQL